MYNELTNNNINDNFAELTNNINTNYAEPFNTPAPEKQTSKTWKGVLIGGFPGIALGAAGAFLATQTLHAQEQVTDVDNNSDDNGINNVPVPTNASLATAVNEDMSFADAFAAAREELGAGGVFVWHGQVYSTYTAEEWAALSPEEQSQFIQNLYSNVGNGDDNNGGGDDNNGGDDGGNDGGNGNDGNGGEDNNGEDNNGNDDGNGGVDILGSDIAIEEIGNMEIEDGLVSVAVGTVDGHEAAFIDVDNDGIVDGVLVDIDNNGEISENEAISLDGSGLTMDDLAAQMNGSDDTVDNIYGNTTDYINDGDTTSLC